MKTIALLCAAGAILACDSPTAPRTLGVPEKLAEAVVVHVREQAVASVINDCTGEDFVLDVIFRDLQTVTPTANGFHATRHASVQGQAVSLLTGARYNVKDLFNLSFNTGAAENFTYHEHFLMIGQGSVPNEVLDFDFHITITPNGDVTSFYDNFKLHCQE